MEQSKLLVSREDYLKLDAQSNIRHEFYQGEIFAMTGGTFNHAKVSLNISTCLQTQLHGKPCQPMNSDMRVQTPSGLDTYPDISIYCGQPELDDKQHTLLNPVVIIEVLSPSTRNDDRGKKFTLYRSIPCLQDYILVEPEQYLVEHFRKIDHGDWVFHEYLQISDQVQITAIDQPLSLSDIYEGIVFAEKAKPDEP